MVSRSGMDNRGSMDNGGMVSRSSMDNRGSMDNGGMVRWGGMDNRGSMVGRSMSQNSLGTMKSVRRVSNGSNSSSKSLGLSGASMFSLVWLGYRLVRYLASWTSMITSMWVSMGHTCIVSHSTDNAHQADKSLHVI